MKNDEKGWLVFIKLWLGLQSLGFCLCSKSIFKKLVYDDELICLTAFESYG